MLVLGASGTVGLIAVQAAKLLGAGRVVAVGRRPEGLERAAELGADATVSLAGDGRPVGGDARGRRRRRRRGRGPAVGAPGGGRPRVPTNRFGRHVALGQSAGAEATFTSAAVRNNARSIIGHTNYAIPAEVRRSAYERMAAHAAAGELTADFEEIPLEQRARGVVAAAGRAGDEARRGAVALPAAAAGLRRGRTAAG